MDYTKLEEEVRKAIESSEDPEELLGLFRRITSPAILPVSGKTGLMKKLADFYHKPACPVIFDYIQKTPSLSVERTVGIYVLGLLEHTPTINLIKGDLSDAEEKLKQYRFSRRVKDAKRVSKQIVLMREALISLEAEA